MARYLIILLQLIILLVIATWSINNSKPVSFTLNDFVITTSTSVLIISIIALILISLVFQRFIFYLKQILTKYKFKREKSKYENGYNSFFRGIIALANKDFSLAAKESKRVNKYLSDKSYSLLLESEIFKIEKKYNQLNNVYESMLKIKDMNLLGLRGLMEQNLREQDFHHAFIYGEKIFKVNPKIDKLYDTLINIISKTNNWNKLIEINNQALKLKIIDKKIYNENTSIAYYEIAKIKKYGFENESIKFMEKAIKLRQFFQPYIYFYLELLIENNEHTKAKKYLKKIWRNLDHPKLNNLIKILSKSLKISFYDLAQYITSGSQNLYQSKILLTESLIEKNNWTDAKKQISSLLDHKPDKDVCLLMAKIEEGENNDPQKINSWINRSNFGRLNKIWICKITNVHQLEWSSLSKSGYFNSLEWRYPNDNSSLNFSQLEKDRIEYIDK